MIANLVSLSPILSNIEICQAYKSACEHTKTHAHVLSGHLKRAQNDFTTNTFFKHLHVWFKYVYASVCLRVSTLEVFISKSRLNYLGLEVCTGEKHRKPPLKKQVEHDLSEKGYFNYA